MQILRLLGGIGLSTADGREVDELLRQPKHVGLLAFLAMPRPGTWHRRDSLLATFWPELDQARARTALRSALHILRRHLAEGTLRNRGDDEVSVDPLLLTTDVAAMIDDVDAGRNAEALGRYAGPLLSALFIADAEGFERWLQRERTRLNFLAKKAATLLAQQLEQSGDLSAAVEAARRVTELDPDDEVAARRLIALLDRAGDRTQAFAVYERFRTHVAEEFGSRPSAETLALVEVVRSRRLAPLPAEPDADEEEVSSPYRPAESPAGVPPGEAVVSPRSYVRRAGLWIGLAAAALLIAAGVFVAFARSASPRVPASTRSIVVLPTDNNSGDSSLDYLGSGLAEGIASRLDAIPGFTVHSGARSDWPATTRHDYKAIGQQFGVSVLLRTSLTKVSDSLELTASVVDPQLLSEQTVAVRRFTLAGIRNLESELAAAVAGTVFRVSLPAIPHPSVRPIDPESYRLMLQGWHELLMIRDEEKAGRLFTDATERDPLNARAWAGLSSVLSGEIVADQVPFEDGYARASAAAERAIALDSLQGTAWVNLAFIRSLRYRSLSAATDLMRRAAQAEPGNPEVFLVQAAIYRSAWHWDQARDAIRVARQLDPLTPYYLDREASLELCIDRTDAALRLFRRELLLSPSNKLAREGFTRSLARSGRFDEAISSWREQAISAKNTDLATRLSHARGADGYWAVKHSEGQRRLNKLQAKNNGAWTSPMDLMRAHFAAGDIEGGFNAIASVERDKNTGLYRLRCMPDLDEVYHTPRFAAVIARIGGLPER